MVSPINRKTLVHEVKFIPTVHTSKLHFSPVATFFTSMRVTEIDAWAPAGGGGHLPPPGI